MSNKVNLNPIKGLNDAKEIFLSFCKKVKNNETNWTYSDFNDYMLLVKQEVDNAYKKKNLYFRDDCLNLVDELHNIISSSLLTKINTASNEELNTFIDGLITSFEEKKGHIANDFRYQYDGNYKFSKFFDFSDSVYKIYEKFFDYEKALTKLNRDFIDSISPANKDEARCSSIWREKSEFLEKLYREKLSNIFLVQHIRSKIPIIKEEYEKVMGHEVSMVDVIEMAITVSIFPEKYKEFEYLKKIDLERYNADAEKPILKESFGNTAQSVYHFLHCVIEVLEGVREEDLLKRTKHVVSFANEKSYDKFKERLNYDLFMSHTGLEFPEFNSVGLHDMKIQLEKKVEDLKEVRGFPIDIKRRKIIDYIKLIWNDLEKETSSEYLMQYGFVEGGGPYSHMKSDMYLAIPNSYTSLLANELEILSTMKVGDKILKDEINKISDTYSNTTIRR